MSCEGYIVCEKGFERLFVVQKIEGQTIQAYRYWFLHTNINMIKTNYTSID